MHGEWEAMGFQQWREHGRAVKKGGKGMAILAPLARSIEVENDQGQTERRTIIKGFKHVVVFGLSQTEGEPYDLHLRIHQFGDLGGGGMGRPHGMRGHPTVIPACRGWRSIHRVI